MKIRNHLAVIIALIEMENGRKLTSKDLDVMLEGAKSVIHKNKVIELNFDSGSRTMSALGNGALDRIRSHKKPYAYYTETIGKYKFVHARVPQNRFVFIPFVPGLIDWSQYGWTGLAIVLGIALYLMAMIGIWNWFLSSRGKMGDLSDDEYEKEKLRQVKKWEDQDED